MAIGTEELSHVEMIVTAIHQPLDKAPPMAADDTTGSTQASQVGSANPQHTIVDGGGAYPHDSNGVPWSGASITASGNLVADFHLDVTAEMQGRLQVARLSHTTDDRGMKDLTRFLVTRDHMHQMQWLAAIEELKADGLDGMPVPEAFPLEEEFDELARTFVQASDGEEATEGRWTSGPAPDGRSPALPPDTPGDRMDLSWSTRSSRRGIGRTRSAGFNRCLRSWPRKDAAG